MPLLWLSLAFVCGILIGASWSLPSYGWVILAVAFTLLGLLPRLTARLVTHSPSAIRYIANHIPRKIIHAINRAAALRQRIRSLLSLPLSIIPIALCLGAFRYQVSLPAITPEHIAWYNDQQEEIILYGTLIEPPDVRDRTVLLRASISRMRTASTLDFTSVHGLVQVYASPGDTFHYGDEVRLVGNLEAPREDEEFSLRAYLAHRGIYSVLQARQATVMAGGQGNPLLTLLYTFRQRTFTNLHRLFPDPEASLMAGILLGVSSGIPEDVQQAFRLTGTSHIIAISGFNITIIAGFISMLSARLLGERRGAIAAAAGIALYTLLVGASAAVVRAAILGGLTLLGRQVGRRQVGLNSLAFVSAIMALADPHILWDIGFQLSFAATLGLMVYAGPFTQAFTQFAARFIPSNSAEKVAGPIGEYFLFTLAAQLTTLPLTLYYFQRLSLVSIIANPLILPAQPAVMILGGIAALLSNFYLPLGKAVSYLAFPFIAYTIRVVQDFAGLRGGSLAVWQLSLQWVMLAYASLAGLTFAWQRVKNLAARLNPALLPLVLAALAFLTWRSAFTAPDGLLHATILDVGTGEAILIQSPTGRYVLINGGASLSRLSEGLGQRLPPLDRRLDWLVVAANGQENLAALPRAIERFPPTGVLWADPNVRTYYENQLLQVLIPLGIPVTEMQPGQMLDLGDDARLTALTVSRSGAILLLEWRSFRLLLPLGMSGGDQEELHNGRGIGHVTALLLAESGYAPVNTRAWLTNLSPQLALLSVAAGDPHDLPSAETLDNLQGFTLLRTDMNGWIELTTDGEQVWVEVEKQ